jgi:hypothetical protein
VCFITTLAFRLNEVGEERKEIKHILTLNNALCIYNNTGTSVRICISVVYI